MPTLSAPAPLSHAFPRRAAAGAALTLILAAGLTGCGHGQYTTEHLNSAQEKVAVLKSGTEWNMAQQQFLAGDLDKAMKNVDGSIALNGKVAKSHLLRGRILIEKGDLEGARKSLQKAEELDARMPEPQYYLGIIHERFREPKLALERYQKALELEPTNPQFLIAGAEMLILQDRLDDADAMLNDHHSDFQYNAAVRQTQGHVTMLRGEPDKASILFGQARLLAPDDLSILEDLARAQVAAGNFSDAEFNIGKLLDASKGKSRRDLQHTRALCLSNLDRPVEARTILLELTSSKEGEGDLRAWIELGNVAAVLSDSARLKTAAARVLALSPDTYEGHFLRALSLRRQGDPVGALASLEKAAARTTTDPGPYILQGLIQQDMGLTREARASFEAAARIDPNNAAARALAGAPTP